MNLSEASIDELRTWLEQGRITSVALVAHYLDRIGGLDHHGPRLNSVPVLNPEAFAEARASDLRRAAGELRSPLDGIPYTAKDSYRVQGLPVSAGSPAFRDLVAGEDAYSIARLRAAGAICLGLTTMPPMANGGMQRGLHGRAESPYNPAYLTSAWGSGSSNGSGTATAAGFAAFGLGEETWSSGRAPANNNSLCAYTPSWGVISTRGNWPLVPSMDVVVPHTRSMADLLAVLEVLVADDHETRGDFWRCQTAVALPAASAHRPASYPALAPASAEAARQQLSGRRLGVPRGFLGREPLDAGTAVDTRPGVVVLFEALAEELRAAGAEVVECDLPALTAYEGDHAHLSTRERPDGGFQGGLEDLGRLPRGYLRTELEDVAAWALDDFLRSNADAGGTGPARLSQVRAHLIFPEDPGQIPDEYGEDFGMGDYVAFASEHGVGPDGTLPGPDELELGEGLTGLDTARRELFDDWLQDQGLDALIFPTSADIAPADADQNPTSHDLAWRNGTWVANGNLLWRHLGIPTVTVPMGREEETRMPFGATLAGAGQDDVALLALAAAVEATGAQRGPTGRRVVPALPDPVGEAVPEAAGTEAAGTEAAGTEGAAEPSAGAEAPGFGWHQDAGQEAVVPLLPEPRILVPVITVSEPDRYGQVQVTVAGDVSMVQAEEVAEASGRRATIPLTIGVDGVRTTTRSDAEGGFSATIRVPVATGFHSHHTGRYGHVVVAVAHTGQGDVGFLGIDSGC